MEAGDSDSESVGDMVGHADADAIDEGAEVVEVPEIVVAAVALAAERGDADEDRRNLRQACASKLMVVRGAGGVSGLTVDLKIMRSHQLGTRCLLLVSYTPFSSSSCTVLSLMNDNLERPRGTSYLNVGGKLIGASRKPTNSAWPFCILL